MTIRELISSYSINATFAPELEELIQRYLVVKVESLPKSSMRLHRLKPTVQVAFHTEGVVHGLEDIFLDHPDHELYLKLIEAQKTYAEKYGKYEWLIAETKLTVEELNQLAITIKELADKDNDARANK